MTLDPNGSVMSDNVTVNGNQQPYSQYSHTANRINNFCYDAAGDLDGWPRSQR
jgi:hypothetical protein